MVQRLFNKFIYLFTCLLLSGFNASAFASDIHSPRTAALGGAGHGGPTLNDAIIMNPSYGSVMQAYSVAVNYGWLEGRTFNISIQDGRSELFQAGASYSQRQDANFIHVGASKNVVEHLWGGLGSKLIFPKDGTRKMITDFTFSGTFLPVGWLQTVLVIDNLIESSEARARGFYREFILGTKINFEGIVLIYFDPHLAPSLSDLGQNSFGHEFGLEFAPFPDFFIRFGQFNNASLPWRSGQRGRGYSFGMGLLAARMSLDYGISRVLEPTGGTSHSIGLSVYF